MRPSTAEGWYVLSIIAISFRKFRGKKPGALRPVNAHNRMGLTSWPGLSRPSTSLVPQDFEDVDARAKRGHDDL
jgi:hypothetical protein